MKIEWKINYFNDLKIGYSMSRSMVKDSEELGCGNDFMADFFLVLSMKEYKYCRKIQVFYKDDHL